MVWLVMVPKQRCSCLDANGDVVTPGTPAVIGSQVAQTKLVQLLLKAMVFLGMQMKSMVL